MEKLMNKRTVLTAKRDDCQKKIRDLGTLPTNLATYADWDTDKLMKKLTKVHEQLAKYKHTNKKALDQFNSFTEQHDQLTKRKDELDESRRSIENLIETLDQKKDEAIQRTFKGIARHFSEVFKELAPSGKGQLVIRKAADEEEDEEEEEEEEEEESGDEAKVEKKTRGKKKVTKGGKKKKEEKKGPGSDTLVGYTGVGIKVSFAKTRDDGSGGSSSEVAATHLMQLSGGQQAIVALALIFAIQRLDPSPFYLFDEIDAALDGVHRTNVAKMIHAQAHELDHPSQFITTTFSAEQIATVCLLQIHMHL
jgi:structural maintenance of chromosome 3 (chondroitin sulfate proteoglycan 6)